MATITVATGYPQDWVPLARLTALARLSGDADDALVSIAGTEPRLLLLTGTGFTYGAGVLPSGGTITGLTVILGAALPGTVLHQVSGLSLAAASFAAAAPTHLWPLLLPGNDLVTGSAGADRLAGGAGDDSIAGGARNDRIDGGSGNDTLAGEAGNDALIGGAGDDLLLPGAGRDIARGDAGNDTIRMTESPLLGGLGVILDGGAGTDALAVALSAGGTLDLAQAQLLGVETLRFETASRFAVNAASLAAIETIELAHDPAAAGGALPALLLRGGGVFVLGGQEIAGASGGRRLAWMMGDENGYQLFGRDAALELADDLIIGGAGASTVFGAGGADSITGGGGGDLLDGEDDADTLAGDAGADTLIGGAGDDRLDGGAGLDSLRGGAGNDTMFVATTGTVENDTLMGEDGDDLLTGGAGFDRLDGGNGADTLEGGDGWDTLTGGGGTDVLRGGSGRDTYVIAANDPDVIDDSDGFDTALILSGTHTVVSGNGIEAYQLLRAGALIGDVADNLLSGSAGADSLAGGGGGDTLFGDGRADTLSGGAGNDAFSFTRDAFAATVQDRITDFSRAPGDADRIDFSRAFFSGAAIFEHGAPTGNAINYFTYETIDGTDTILRAFREQFSRPPQMVLNILVEGITGPWTLADFIL